MRLLMAKSKLSAQDRSDIKTLYKTDKEKWTKYRLAVMYGVSWRTIHYVIDEEARNRNNEANKARNRKARA